MAEVEKQNELPEEDEVTEEVDVEIEGGEEEIPQEEQPEEDFYRNLAEEMDDRALGRLSAELIQDYKRDKVSRSDWEQAYTSGLDLLGFKYVNNTRPFQGASGVTHPLLSEAVTQFQAQAYKELLPSDGPVRTAVIGSDTPETQQQAERVKDFMNYMLMEEMEEYTPDTDQMLFYLPLAGSAFKKIYYDEIKQRAVSKFVPAEDLIVPYYATDLKDCERITHVVKMSENDVLKQQKAGFYRDVEIPEAGRGKESEIEKLCKHSGLMERKAANAERESTKLYQTMFMYEHVGDVFDGVVSGITEWGVFVEIIVNKCEGLVRLRDIDGDYYIYDQPNMQVVGQRTKNTIKLGEKVTVKVEAADLATRRIDLKIMG